MEWIKGFLNSLHGEHLQHLIATGGFALLFAIVFAETGLFVGFFLPGDSLLFTAGALVGSGILKAPPPLPHDPFTALIALNITLISAAVLGDTTGYWFGRRTGPRLFNRPNSRLFRREHLIKTQEFYERNGGKTLIMARWVPFARTFAPIVAGVAEMPFTTFITYSIVGGITWVLGCTLLGFCLGGIAWVKENNEKVILLIIAFSLAPAVLHWLKDRLKTSKSSAATVAPARGEDA